jgi:hypothetical protein
MEDYSQLDAVSDGVRLRASIHVIILQVISEGVVHAVNVHIAVCLRCVGIDFCGGSRCGGCGFVGR